MYEDSANIIFTSNDLGMIHAETFLKQVGSN